MLQRTVTKTTTIGSVKKQLVKVLDQVKCLNYMYEGCPELVFFSNNTTKYGDETF